MVCNQANNNQTADIRGEASGILGFHKWLLQKSGKLEVPLHAHCSKALKRRLLWRNIGVLIVATALVLVWFTMRVYEVEMPFELNKTTLCIAAVIIFIPLFILEEMRPSAFEYSLDDNFASYQFKSRDYAEEFEALNEKDQEKRAAWLAEKAEDFIFHEKYQEAIEPATEYIKLKPLDSIGYELRGEALLRLKKFEAALADLNKSLEISPENPYAFRLRAYVNRKLGRRAEARADRQRWKTIEEREEFVETDEADETA